MLRLLTLTALPLLAAAQSAAPSMSSPMLGYIFDDNSKSIRAVSGVPGAAGLEAAVDFGATVDSAFVHSRARLAIANSKDGGIVLLRWDGSPRLISLQSSLTKVVAAGFSRSGDYAIVGDGQGGVETWSGLRGDPVNKGVYGTESLGGIATALAINDGGLAIAGTDAGGLVRLGDSPVTLAATGAWAALSFLPNQTDALALDAAAGRLTLIRDVANSADQALVSEGLQQSSAVSISEDGARVAVAMPASQSISFLDMVGGSPTAVDCQCKSARFEPLNGNLVFRIVDPQANVLRMLDGDGLTPRIVPIPEFSLTNASARTN